MNSDQLPTLIPSQSGIALIKALEGFRADPYPDGPGWSIGYGCYMGTKKPKMRVDRNQAHQLMMERIREMGKVISKAVTVPLLQYEADALFSFVYNVGTTQFLSSTLLRKLNEGDREGAAAEFYYWIYETKNGKKVVNKGLEGRRSLEAELFAGKNT